MEITGEEIYLQREFEANKAAGRISIQFVSLEPFRAGAEQTPLYNELIEKATSVIAATRRGENVFANYDSKNSAHKAHK